MADASGNILCSVEQEVLEKDQINTLALDAPLASGGVACWLEHNYLVRRSTAARSLMAASGVLFGHRRDQNQSDNLRLKADSA